MDVLKDAIEPLLPAANHIIMDTTPDAVVSITSNFFAATINSLAMIIVTEIGDKTFFIAAVLAMRHGRIVVYAGAMGKINWSFYIGHVCNVVTMYPIFSCLGYYASLVFCDGFCSAVIVTEVLHTYSKCGKY